MSDTLSQDEVDALLRGISDGEVAVAQEEQPKDGSAQSYDLLRAERHVARQMHGLDMVHERFVRRLRSSFGALLGSTVSIELANSELLKFGTLRNRLPQGSSLSLFSLAPLRGQALFTLSPNLAFSLVDRIFGGTGRAPLNLEKREYSAIELQTIQRVVSLVLGDLNEAWSMVLPLRCSFVRTEVNPAMVSITGVDEVVLSLDLQCDLGTGPHRMVLACPYATLEPLRSRLGDPQSGDAGADREWLSAVSQAVQLGQVDFSAELGRRDLSMRDILRLKVGDVLQLETRGEDPLLLLAEGIPVLRGLAGVSRGQNAVRVLAPVSER